MKYKVQTFFKGKPRAKSIVDAGSHRQAASFGKTLGQWTHVVVKGKSVKRFTNTLKEIRGLPKIFKTTKGAMFCVLLMWGGVAEMYGFSQSQNRDEAYEKICTALESAASARASQQQTDITAYSEGMSVSKNILTSKKTSNGYAMNVIWRVLETLSNIDNSSGKTSVVASEKSTWSTGSTPSPSNPKKKTFLVTVDLDGKDESQYPTFTSQMKLMNGKTIRVTKVDDIYYGTKYYWHRSWLNFNKATVKVKNVPVGTVGKTGLTFTRAMSKVCGKVFSARQCIGHYTIFKLASCYETEWLEPYNEEDNKLKYKANPAANPYYIIKGVS